MMPKRTDANQSAIVETLRAVGAEVQDLSGVGHGCPDLLIAFRGNWYVAEIKDGAKPPSKQKLTPPEIRWHEQFGRVAEVHVWRDEDEALRGIGAI